MKNAMSFLAVSLLFSSIAFSAPAPNDVTGNWKGILQVGELKLHLVFKITKSANGALSAKMDSLDQGARDLPVDIVTVKNNTLHMEVSDIQGIYEGTLDNSGAKATGKWQQGQQTLPLILERNSGKADEVEVESFSPADLAANKAAADKLAGSWEGNLNAGTQPLRLVLNVRKTAAGKGAGMATGTIDSPDQGAKDIPLSAITYKDGKVRFEARGIGGSYEGSLEGAGGKINGEWKQGGQTMPLNFQKKTPSSKPAK
jgi:hypothetical protein